MRAAKNGKLKLEAAKLLTKCTYCHLAFSTANQSFRKKLGVARSTFGRHMIRQWAGNTFYLSQKYKHHPSDESINIRENMRVAKPRQRYNYHWSTASSFTTGTTPVQRTSEGRSRICSRGVPRSSWRSKKNLHNHYCTETQCTTSGAVWAQVEIFFSCRPALLETS